jgi:hypothetical protein
MLGTRQVVALRIGKEGQGKNKLQRVLVHWWIECPFRFRGRLLHVMNRLASGRVWKRHILPCVFFICHVQKTVILNV